MNNFKFIFTNEEQVKVFDNVFKNMTDEEIDALGSILTDVSHYGYMRGIKDGAKAMGLGIISGVCLVKGTKGIIRIHNERKIKRAIEERQ